MFEFELPRFVLLNSIIYYFVLHVDTYFIYDFFFINNSNTSKTLSN